ncbi:rRNA maturation RNase YbeY [Aliiroseovarius sp. YM-037]|uniref:rRNA maturation RNase YbeY n=1 Tax=Aliiroseovarius sp. YM-037 TaxID=3341728 RepID=UPI003A80883A
MTAEPVDTVLEYSEWDAFGLPTLANRAATATLAHLGLAPEQFEIVLMGCDDARIAALNTSFRDKTTATNVLSWPSEERGADAPGEAPVLPVPNDGDDPTELGDIAIAYETCMREAEEASIAPTDHVTHLVVHAVLHLLGYDHIDDKDAALMEALETEILGKLGVADPYGA